MTGRQLVDWVYFVLADGRTSEDLDALDELLIEPLLIDNSSSQEDRLAAIMAIGGGVA